MKQAHYCDGKRTRVQYGSAPKSEKQMSRYYDTLSIDCEGCRYMAQGAFPNGTPYKACRWYGYIFHEDKGISQERCEIPNRIEPKYNKQAKSIRGLKQ